MKLRLHKQPPNLMEQILCSSNLRTAAEKVLNNHGSPGIDGMRTSELFDYLQIHENNLRRSILDGSYQPSPFRSIEISKKDGGTRNLEIPTVMDRMLQQAISKILSPIYEPLFSDNSFAYRTGRNQHDAICRCLQYVKGGKCFAFHLDLERFFETVNHRKLKAILQYEIRDIRLLTLIFKFLKAGLFSKGHFSETSEGIPQGSPLSPLLANIFLNELDWYLSDHGYSFVRYADDIVILFDTEEEANQKSFDIIKFINEELYLTTNKAKSGISHITEICFLGFGFHHTIFGIQACVHKKSKKRLCKKIKDVMFKSNGLSLRKRTRIIIQAVKGWRHYYCPSKINKSFV